MYPAQPNTNRSSWASQASWPPADDRSPFRPREEQSLPRPPAIDDRNIHHSTMMQASSSPGEGIYPQQLPPPSEMWPQVSREPILPVQPAPRQRTAIACRYCRRRKIRCSGFDSSADGRCGNCLRFNQECVFTPVSSQAQAFVPAHTQYPHLKQGFIPPRGGPARPIGQLYGPYGQPLQLHSLGSQGEYIHQSYGRPPSPNPGASYARAFEGDNTDRERSTPNDRPPSLPPLTPNNYQPTGVLQRRGSAGDYPSYWRNSNSNPAGINTNINNPASPSTSLPPPRSYSPPRVLGQTNPPFHHNSLPQQPSGHFPNSDFDRGYNTNSIHSTDPSQLGSSHQRRLSDAREGEQKDSRYPSDSHPYPFPPHSSRGGQPALQTPPRASSTGPTTSHPMQLSNLIDPNPPHRSDVDTRMLKSLNFKT